MEFKRPEHGYSVTEFAVVISMILIGVVLISSGCLTKGHKDRFAETKSNIHTIQIALERYSVDTGGRYPPFLVGGEPGSNILTSYRDMNGNGVSLFPPDGMTPFAQRYSPSTGGPEFITYEDPLITSGYLAEYPTNPFASDLDGRFSVGDSASPGRFPYGGIKGDKMFDLGFGWGDTPQTDFILTPGFEYDEEQQGSISGGSMLSDPDNEAPGNFYYHPVFKDNLSVYFHYAFQYDVVNGGNSTLGTYGLTSLEVVTYNLLGFGAPDYTNKGVEGGYDYFPRLYPPADLPSTSPVIGFLPGGKILDSSVNPDGQLLVGTTGYMSWEYDPWMDLYADGILPSNPVLGSAPKSGADGFNDWVIIEVTQADIKWDPEWDQKFN